MRAIKLYYATVRAIDDHACVYVYPTWARTVAQAYKRLTRDTDGRIPDGWALESWRV
jgi:hypothetical protein